MPIALGGLATGLDTSALVQQLLALERRPVTLLQERQQRLQDQAAAFRDLNTRLLALKTAVEALQDPAEFFARSATSSVPDVATVTAAPGASRGSFSLTVDTLARGAIASAANTVAALDDVVASGAGMLEFRVGADGTPVSVPITATTTLAQLVVLVNDAGAGVHASAVNVGTAAAPAFKLVLTSDASGAADDIAILADGTTLGVLTTQTGLDAAFSVAGLGTLTRPSNTFADVIDGMTVTLRGTGTTVVALDYDSPATAARLGAVVDAYNAVIEFLASQAAGAPDGSGRPTAGPFTGDVVARQVRSRLAGDLAASVAGTFQALAEVGVTTNRDGTLALDVARLESALAADPQAVAALVAGTATTDGVADRLVTSLEGFTRALTGALAVRQQGIGDSIRGLQAQIDAALVRLDREEEILRAKFAAMEAAVARIQNQGSALLSALQGLAASGR